MKIRRSDRADLKSTRLYKGESNMILTQQKNKLCMRLEEELVEIEAWGTNALRVRATRNARFSDGKKGIDHIAPGEVEICVEKRRGSIRNGKITALDLSDLSPAVSVWTFGEKVR